MIFAGHWVERPRIFAAQALDADAIPSRDGLCDLVIIGTEVTTEFRVETGIIVAAATYTVDASAFSKG